MVSLKFCPSCGSEISEDDVEFCTECGCNISHPTKQVDISSGGFFTEMAEK